MNPNLTAMLGAAALVMVCAHAHADEPTPPSQAVPPSPSAQPASPVTPAHTPAATATSPAPSPAQPEQAGAAPDGTAPKPADDELEMHFTSTRPTDMESFAKASAQETRVVGSKARYSLNFFGDTFAAISGGQKTTTKSTFGVGSFSILFSGELGSNVKATAEPAIEFNEENQPGIDLERLHLRYTQSGFWVEAGRSHTDLGYWNNAYHHGRWLQPTVERPRAVHFEDENGILPVHWVGAQIGYTATVSRQMSLTASVAAGNGRGTIVDNVQSGGDKRPEKQGYGKLELKGLGHRDLRIGVSGVYGKISGQDATIRPALPDSSMNEIIGNVYVAFPSDPILAIAEGYLISHDGPLRSWETYVAFAVLGYSIPPVTPYIKVERVVMTAGSDPFFVPDPAAAAAAELDVYEAYAGLRIDVSTWSAVKSEYRITRTLLGDWRTIHEGIVAWQFGI